MAWGLEARVPFLDKNFLDVAMNVDPKYKMFSKGLTQEIDEDGQPRMEKVVIFFHFDIDYGQVDVLCEKKLSQVHHP